MQLFLSRYPDHATRALLAGLKESLAQGRRAFLVVPSQFTLEAEEELFQSLGEPVLMQAQVKSFQSLERDILERAGGQATSSLSDRGRRMLLRFLLEKGQADRKVFTGHAAGEGLSELLLKNLKEWTEYGLEPEDLATMAKSFADQDHSAEKLRALSTLYAQYQAFLEEKKVLDAAGRTRYAIQELEKEDLFSQIDFYFDRFHSMSDLELDFLHALEKDHPISMALTLDPKIVNLLESAPAELPSRDLEGYWLESSLDAPAFTFSVRFFQKLKKIFPHLETKPIEPASTATGSGESASDRRRRRTKDLLSQAVFSGQPVQDPSQLSGVFLSSYPSTLEEMQDTIVSMRRIKDQEGLDWKDFLIYLAEEEEYGDRLSHLLDLEGIPYFHDSLKRVSYHPLLQTIRAFLSLSKKGLNRRDLLLLLKAGLLDISEEEADLYQNFILRRHIHFSMFLDPKYFRFSGRTQGQSEQKAQELEEEFARAWAVNQRLLESLQPFLLSGRAQAADFSKGLLDFLLQESIRQQLILYSEELEESGREEESARDRQVWDSVIAILEEMVLLFPKEEMDFSLYADLLEEGLSSISLGVIPPFQNQVLLVDLRRSRVRGRKHVFLLGMSDAFLPAVWKTSDLLSQEEKDLLQEDGFALPSMQTFQSQEEALNFYSLLHRSDLAFHLSYSKSSMENASMEASPWFRVLAEEEDHPGLGVRRMRDFSSQDLLYSRRLFLASLARGLQDQEAGAQAMNQDFQALAKDRPELAQMASLVEVSLDKPRLSMELVQALYPNETISASQLETMARCPYRYFIHYGLRPQEDQDLRLDPGELGSLLHASLKDWISLTPQRIRAMGEEASKKELAAIFQAKEAEAFDPWKRAEGKNSFLFGQSRRTLLEDHFLLYDQILHSRVQQMEGEVFFGPASRALPGLSLAGPSREIFLQGTIDRVDLVRSAGESYLQVLDYKTGKRDFRLTDALQGTYLQLPLYLKAYLEGKKKEELKPVGAFYLPIRPREKLDVRLLDQKAGPGSGAASPAPDPVGPSEKLDGFVLDEEAISLFDDRMGEKDKEALYRLRGTGGRDNRLAPEEGQAFLSQVSQKAQELVAQRERGSIAIRPLYVRGGYPDQQGCAYCPYRSLCHFERDKHFSRQRIVDPVDWKTWKKELQWEKAQGKESSRPGAPSQQGQKKTLEKEDPDALK